MVMLILFLLALSAYISYRIFFWINEGQKLQSTGYLPPAPSIFGRSLLRLLSRIGCCLFVGPIKVVGEENISINERLVVISNHQFRLDFMVLTCALPYSFRHLAKAEEVRGWRAPLAALTGHFAVDVEYGRAKSGLGSLAVDTCVRVLTHDIDNRLLIFPQGKIVAENKLTADDFRTGVMRAAQIAMEKMPYSLISIQPVAIQYQRDPEQAAFLSQLAAKLGLRNFDGVTNYGATVTIGKQILITQLPNDVKQATQTLRIEIQNLLKKNGKESFELH
jgi:1-acyl-sn-glycerol-3-phosphate acyltransferase